MWLFLYLSWWREEREKKQKENGAFFLVNFTHIYFFLVCKNWTRFHLLLHRFAHTCMWQLVFYFSSHIFYLICFFFATHTRQDNCKKAILNGDGMITNEKSIYIFIYREEIKRKKKKENRQSDVSLSCILST